MTIAYAALVDGPPEAIAADAVHGESQLASIADAHPGAELQTTEMGHSLVEILPFCRDMLGSAVADATRRSTESSENYRQLCHAAMLRLRAFFASWPRPLGEHTRRGNARRLRLRLRRRARPATGREHANAR